MARIALITPDLFNEKAQLLRFEATGHLIIKNPNVSQALEALLNNPPDILIIQKGLEGQLDQDAIKALKNNLQLALLPIILVVSPRDLARGLDWSNYPVDDLISNQASVEEIITRVGLALARSHRIADNNPLTMLPGNSSILKGIQDILDSNEPRAVCYVDIDNFKPFNDRYGFARGDEVIRMVSRILVNTVQERAGSDGFVGHVGGDDFVFMVSDEHVEAICKEIIDNFSMLMPLFIDEEDLNAGCFRARDRQGRWQSFDLTSLSIAVIPATKAGYKHYGEVAAAAALLKKKVKKLPGSNFLIDRRKEKKG